MKTFILTHARDGNVHKVCFSAPDFEAAARDVLTVKAERGIRPIAVKEHVPESWVGRVATLLGVMIGTAIVLGPTVQQVWESGGSWGRVLQAVIPTGVVVVLVTVARMRAPKAPFPVLNRALESGPPAYNGKARWFILAGLLVGAIASIIASVGSLKAAGESEIKLMQTGVNVCVFAFLCIGIGEFWPKAPKAE